MTNAEECMRRFIARMARMSIDTDANGDIRFEDPFGVGWVYGDSFRPLAWLEMLIADAKNIRELMRKEEEE